MSEQDLRLYYNYLYPFETIVLWLTHNNNSQLAHRELSFQYKDIGVQRYVTFANSKAMKNRMTDRHSTVPIKVDAGAIWNKIPQKQNIGKTIERELIFDFDMNDYDDVRTCCQGKKVCYKCWKLLVIAVQVIQKALQEDFGFTKLLFVFSGGRGLHIWVCDKRARQLKDSVRKSLVDYLELITGNDKAESLLADRVISKAQRKPQKNQFSNRQKIKKQYIANYISAHVQRSISILMKRFVDIAIQQNIFGHQKCIDIIFKILSNRHEKLKQKVEQRWGKAKIKTQQIMWNLMIQEIIRYQYSETINDYINGKQPSDKMYRLSFIEEQIILSFLYPRIDHHVSTMQNHLLKLPFSVHPSSKNISVPLSRTDLETFNPQNCIKIGPLLNQLQNIKQNDMLDENQNEVNGKKTDLALPIKILQQFTLKMQ